MEPPRLLGTHVGSRWAEQAPLAAEKPPGKAGRPRSRPVPILSCSILNQSANKPQYPTLLPKSNWCYDFSAGGGQPSGEEWGGWHGV